MSYYPHTLTYTNLVGSIQEPTQNASGDWVKPANASESVSIECRYEPANGGNQKRVTSTGREIVYVGIVYFDASGFRLPYDTKFTVTVPDEEPLIFKVKDSSRTAMHTRIWV